MNSLVSGEIARNVLGKLRYAVNTNGLGCASAEKYKQATLVRA